MVFAVFASAWLGASHNLCVYSEGLGDIDYFLGVGRLAVYFHSVAHIVNFVHFSGRGFARMLDCPENRRRSEEVVFYKMDAFAEAHALPEVIDQDMSHGDFLQDLEETAALLKNA